MSSTKAFTAHLENESRLLARDPASMIFSALLPIAAIIVMSAIPSARKPLAEFGGLSVVATYLPVIILFATSILGLTVIPAILGGYREMGVLKRLRTTPSSPMSLLMAVFTVIGLVGVVVCVILTVTPALAGAGLPKNLGIFVLCTLLSLGAFCALGVILAAVVPNSKAAAGIGNAIAALMWFFAGLWYPRTLFPDWLATIAELTPGGAAATAMTNASLGLDVDWKLYVVLIVWTLASGVVASRIFTWE